MSSVMVPSIILRIYLPMHWGRFLWILSLSLSFSLSLCYIASWCWMIGRYLGILLISLGIGPAVVLNKYSRVLSGWSTWLNTLCQKSTRTLCIQLSPLCHCLGWSLGHEFWLMWLTGLCHQRRQKMFYWRKIPITASASWSNVDDRNDQLRIP